MDDFVDRISLRDALYKADAITMEGAKIINQIPSADVAPVRHGRWIDAYPEIEPNPLFMYGFCSECGFEQGMWI